MYNNGVGLVKFAFLEEALQEKVSLYCSFNVGSLLRDFR